MEYIKIKPDSEFSGDYNNAAKEVFENKLNVDSAAIRQILDTSLKSGGDFADVYFEYSASNSVIMEDGIIKSSSKAVSMGMGIRVLKGDQTGYAFSEDLDLKAMKHAAQTASAIAVNGNVKEFEGERFNENSHPNYYQIKHSISDIDIAEKITGSKIELSDNPKQEIVDILRAEYDLID